MVKGWLIVRLNKLQEKVEKPKETKVHAIGFSIPSDEDYEEELEEDDCKS